jgi:hypothetical protein
LAKEHRLGYSQEGYGLMQVCSNKIILVDIDSTVLDFPGAFARWVSQRVTPRKSIRESVNFVDFLGVEEEVADQHMVQFIASDEFERIEPLACAGEVLPRLHREGYRFVAISAVEPVGDNLARRTRNLREAFGFDFEEVHLSGYWTGHGKGPYLSRFEPTIWVEDHVGNAHVGAQHGHHAVLLNHFHNRHEDAGSVTRVDDWHDIANELDNVK